MESPSASPRNTYRKRRSMDGASARILMNSSGIPMSQTEAEYVDKNKPRGRLIRGEGTPPRRVQRSGSRSDFLQQVAAKLADGVESETTTASGTDSYSPAETPMLPALSPCSSVGTFFFESSSDMSGMSTPTNGYSGKVKTHYSASETTTPRSRKGHSRSGSLASGILCFSLHSFTHSLTHSLSLTLTLTHSLTHSLTHARMHTLARMHSRIDKQTHADTRRHTHTHAHTQT